MVIESIVPLMLPHYFRKHVKGDVSTPRMT